MRIADLMCAAVLFSGISSAQWLHYPTANVPKTPSGIPNLGAPAPRTPDGHPDLSGVWEPENTIPCPPEGCLDGLISYQYFDIAYGMKGGLPYQPWAAAQAKARREQMGKDDPTARCFPPGVPRFHAMPTYRRILQTPGLIVELLEHNATYREIFTDGRPLPVDPQPTWNGYSTGHWDGDTLVVETNGLRDGIWLDRNGSPLTEGAKMTERFHRVNYGRLEIELTMNDPKAYTKPWSVTLNQNIVLNTELLDYFCTDNEKDARHVNEK